MASGREQQGTPEANRNFFDADSPAGGKASVYGLVMHPSKLDLLAFPPTTSFATSRDGSPPTGARAFRKVKHGVPQQPICFGLITTTIGLKPGDDVGIQADGDCLLLWPVELPDLRPAPIENRGRVAEINVLVSFCGDGLDVSLLFP